VFQVLSKSASLLEVQAPSNWCKERVINTAIENGFPVSDWLEIQRLDLSTIKVILALEAVNGQNL